MFGWEVKKFGQNHGLIDISFNHPNGWLNTTQKEPDFLIDHDYEKMIKDVFNV